jgi:hypothetical protein
MHPPKKTLSKLLFCLLCCAQSGCGEKLHYKKYEFDKSSISFNDVLVGFSILTTFKEDPKNSNKGTYGPPYTIRLSFIAPNSAPIESVELKKFVVTGVAHGGNVKFETFKTDKFWISLQYKDKIEGAIIIPLPEGDDLKHEDLHFSGILSFNLSGKKELVEESFDVVLKAKVSEEKKGKRLAEILGI